MKESISVATRLSMMTIAASIAVGLALGFWSLQVVKKNKVADSWAMLFLQMERYANLISGRISILNSATSQKPPALTLKLESDTDQYVSDEGVRFPVKTIGIDPRNELAPRENLILLTSIDGQLFLATTKGTTLHLWRAGVTDIFGDTKESEFQGSLYLTSRDGKLLFSNSTHITEESFASRPLVQRFVTLSTNQGQVEFTDQDGTHMGFYTEIPKSNSILFVELNHALVTAPVNRLTVEFSSVLLLFCVILGMLVFAFSTRLMQPIRDLILAAREIAKGNALSLAGAGVGEIGTLEKTFESMAEALSHSVRHSVQKELRYVEPILSPVVKVAPLTLPDPLKNSFCVEANLNEYSPIEIAFRMIGNAEHGATTDWFATIHDPKSEETVVWLAALSSVKNQSQHISALMSGLVSEADKNRKEFFDSITFLTDLNFLLFRLGKGKWSVPFSGIRYVPRTPSIDIYNCGQASPIIFFPGKGPAKKELTTSNSKSSNFGPLGQIGNIKPTPLTTTFQKGCLVMAEALPLTVPADSILWPKNFINTSKTPLQKLLETIRIETNTNPEARTEARPESGPETRSHTLLGMRALK